MVFMWHNIDMRKLSLEKRKAVLNCLVEGVSVNATARMTGVAKTTILRFVRNLGNVCAKYHDTHVRGLSPRTIETDEVWSFVYAKQKNVPTDMQGEFGYGDVWTWTAITDTKLIAAYHLGLRTQADADAFMLDLAGRIINRTQLTSDGLAAYLPAVENAFGSEIDFAQLVKSFGDSKGNSAPTSEVRYSPPKFNGSKKVKQIGLPAKADICTSHVERHNLTIRMQMRRFTRLTNAHSKKVEFHEHSLAIFFMFYNFCRVHSTMKTTPAVASGLTDRVWTPEELLALLPDERSE